MLKYDYYRGWYRLLNGVRPVFILRDLELKQFSGAPYDFYVVW